MVIKHCMEAMNANRQLDMTVKSSQISARNLSSGYKINIAADDAAGLAISEKMRKQIRGLTQAQANAEDGISLVQIADGALNEVHDMLQRMNELCVKAANGPYSETDRRYIQDEVEQLSTEIDRVASTTKFNEIYLLDGSVGNPYRTAQHMAEDDQKMEEFLSDGFYDDDMAYTYTALNGANAGQAVTLSDVEDASGIKIVYYDYSSAAASSVGSGNLTSTDPKYTELKRMLQEEIVPNAVKALVSAYSPAFDELSKSTIAIGLDLDANLGSGVLAQVGVNYSYYVPSLEVVQDKLSYTLAVNTTKLSYTTNSNNATTLTDDSRKNLEVTIVHEMMHAFMDEMLTNGMIGIVNGALDDKDSYPKWFVEGMAQTAAGAYYDDNDFIKSMGIPDNPTSASQVAQVEQALNQYKLGGADNESNYGTGYLACMYLGYLKNGTNTVSAQAISSGLSDVLKDLNDNKSLDDVLQGLGYTSIDDFQNRFASDAATFVCDLSNVVNSGGNTGTGGLVGGLVTNDDILPDNKENVSLFQLNTVSTSMVNTYPAGYDIRSGGSATNGKGGYTGTPGGTGTSGGGGGGNGGGGSVSFYANSRTKYSGLKLQVGADSSSPNQIRIFIDAMNSKSLGVNKVNVTTQDLARMSIERVSLALAEVSRQRAELGSYQNRIEHTVKNLGNVIENTTASESQIRDTDMATEMVRYANSNILMNAGWSVLAQATQSNVGVLNLLS